MRYVKNVCFIYNHISLKCDLRLQYAKVKYSQESADITANYLHMHTSHGIGVLLRSIILATFHGFISILNKGHLHVKRQENV